MSFDLSTYLKTQKNLVDQSMHQLLWKENEWPQKLIESIHYSLFAGGKRLRPILAIAACEALEKNTENVMPIACALEMIHTYSLIHDDLPSMDDDDLRRGRPTNHKVFGEAIAILSGDALLTEAFTIITKASVAPEICVQIIRTIAEASGVKGMVGGQVQDLISENHQISAQELENLHRHKTGKLIQASIVAGALAAQANDTQLSALSQYGECIGLSFQIADDLLDIEGGEEIGKDIGSDLEKNKATYPSLLGLKKSKQLAANLTEKAITALKVLGPSAAPLREIAQFVVSRKS